VTSHRIAAAALFIAIFIAAVAPIRSYDYFWHLATGRWIAEHRALPATDPFAVASARVPWINGEWLWELGAYGAHRIGGDAATAIANALLIAAIFTIAVLGRSGSVVAAASAASAGGAPATTVAGNGITIFVSAVAFAGAAPLLGVRPATAAALFVAIALALLQSSMPLKRLAIAYALLTIVWINVHPSALLAPLLAAITLLIDGRRLYIAAASAVALFVNPFGWRAIEAPLRLASEVSSGEYVNAEWQVSRLADFPLLYATILAVALAFLVTRRELWRVLVFTLFAVLAIRYVRNQGLYFAALPLLLPALKVRRNNALALLAIVPIAWTFARGDHRPRVDDERFPVRAVAALKASNLPGNIYNSDQFGGLLEWTFYPQRRAITDGRNELFRSFIALESRARRDSRAWRQLLLQYDVDLAVAEYETQRIDVLDVASGEHRSLPASLVRFRRRDWALIAFDDAAMVFARRAAFAPERLSAIEYRYLVPDDPSIDYATPQIRDAARSEIARAKREVGESRVIRELKRGAS
jgi:hypothetical protein